MLDAKPKWSLRFHMFMEDFVTNNISREGKGIVQPELASKMDERLRSHLESTGIDEVKIHVIQVSCSQTLIPILIERHIFNIFFENCCVSSA